MSWDDRMKHLDPQVASQYDLIALETDIKAEPTVFDCVRYIAKIVSEEMGVANKWQTPYVHKWLTNNDTTSRDFGTHVVLTMSLRKGSDVLDFRINALLRQVSEEWFMVRYAIERDREAMSPVRGPPPPKQ